MAAEYKWDIPLGTDPAKCRSCSAVIYWIKTPNGKKMPLNEDGYSHFSTCPNADDHRKAPATSQPSPTPAAAPRSALTFRDHVAIAAVTAVLKERSLEEVAQMKMGDVADIAYTMADAMEKRRSQ